eukprot:TRINITY_DN19244_c0_g1_i1.p1 TRINITY_DN19244_c0_g1~~TRINITY_DN19244_c0_g1_i1.p1  ORF type:complete len:469 (-),score=72.44 TRINITY_DN19244_c0_g1_i1:17-1372(-)
MAAEVLRRYSDLLRVGRLRVNGEVVTWETNTSTELQLQSLSDNLGAKLRELLPEQEPSVLSQAVLCLCKAVSINYALIEVLLLVRQRLGVFCTIETREDNGGATVEYVLDVLPGPSLRASLEWSKAGNIIYRDPHTGSKKVKGTISNLSARFKLPPTPGSVPDYRVEMRLRKTFVAHVATKFVCSCADRGVGEELVIQEPLCAHQPLLCEADLPEVESEPQPLRQEICVRNSQDSSIISKRSDLEMATATLPEPEVVTRPPIRETGTWIGSLKVNIRRVQLVNAGSLGQLYATCSVADKCVRTGLTPASGNPIWLDARWKFPVSTDDLRRDVTIEVFRDLGDPGKLELICRTLFPIGTALESEHAVKQCTACMLGKNSSTRSTVEIEQEFLSECPASQPVDVTPETEAPSPCTPVPRIRVQAVSAESGTCGFGRSTSLWCSTKSCAGVGYS